MRIGHCCCFGIYFDGFVQERERLNWHPKGSMSGHNELWTFLTILPPIFTWESVQKMRWSHNEVAVSHTQIGSSRNTPHKE